MPSTLDPLLFQDGAPFPKASWRQTLADIKTALNHGGWPSATSNMTMAQEHGVLKATLQGLQARANAAEAEIDALRARVEAL